MAVGRSLWNRCHGNRRRMSRGVSWDSLESDGGWRTSRCWRSPLKR